MMKNFYIVLFLISINNAFAIPKNALIPLALLYKIGTGWSLNTIKKHNTWVKDFKEKKELLKTKYKSSSTMSDLLNNQNILMNHIDFYTSKYERPSWLKNLTYINKKPLFSGNYHEEQALIKIKSEFDDIKNRFQDDDTDKARTPYLPLLLDASAWVALFYALFFYKSK